MMLGWTEIKDAAQVEARSPHWMPAFDVETEGCSRVGLGGGKQWFEGISEGEGNQVFVISAEAGSPFQILLLSVRRLRVSTGSRTR